MRSQKAVRAAVLAIGALLAGTCAGQAGAITYDVAIVQFEMGVEDFSTETPSGTLDGIIMSSNLPIGLASSSGNYTPVGFQNPYSGVWDLSDETGSTLSLAFDSPGRNFGFAGPLGRSVGTTTILGGTGAFAGATGGGSFEAFARDGTLFDTFVQGYEQVVINRLQITLPSGPEQTDTRPVSVSARIGIDNVDTSHGVNIGSTTSDSAPGPWLTNLRSEYDFGTLPYSGFSEGSNGLGDVQHWVFETADQYALSSFFTLSTGNATLVSGEGIFEGFTGSSDWEAFAVGRGPVSDNVFSYSVVTVDRYVIAPIPEPQTYAMLLAGFAGIAFTLSRRRRSRLPA